MVQPARDPWRTAAILLAFITEYNIVLALLHIITAAITGDAVRPTDRVWDFRETHFGHIPGYRTCFVLVSTACLMVPISVLQIARAKLILDFAMTAQLSHLLLTCLYSGRIPFTWSWWLIWFMSSCIMVFGGEYACMQVELRPIHFGGANTQSSNEQSMPLANQQNVQEPRASTNSRLGRLSNVSGRNSNDDIEMQERDALMEEGQSSRLKP